MRWIIGLLTIALTILFLTAFVQVGARNASGPPIRVECPARITTAITNFPPGWTPLVAPGAATVQFQELSVTMQNDTPQVACYYSNKPGTFAEHALTRNMPKDYVCAIEKKSEKSRVVYCRTATR